MSENGHGSGSTATTFQRHAPMATLEAWCKASYKNDDFLKSAFRHRCVFCAICSIETIFDNFVAVVVFWFPHHLFDISCYIRLPTMLFTSLESYWNALLFGTNIVMWFVKILKRRLFEGQQFDWTLHLMASHAFCTFLTLQTCYKPSSTLVGLVRSSAFYWGIKSRELIPTWWGS